MAMSPARSKFLASSHLPRVLHLSANDNGDNEVKPDTVQRSTVEVDHLMRTVRQSTNFICKKWQIFFHDVLCLDLFYYNN